MSSRYLFPALDNGNLSQLVFNAASSVFTAGIAKRLISSVFSTAPIVQGKADGSGYGDVVTYLYKGSTIVKNNFFSTFDLYQGSISFWVIPEWNGNDGITHWFLSADNAPGTAFHSVEISKTASNTLYAKVGTSGWSTGVSTATWVAGSPYHIVFSWDTKNKIDGTNYARISVNDVHTFGMTTPFSSYYTDNQFFVGGHSTGLYSANSVIMGLTKYRRVLWDGAYGKNFGNGDEINLIYAAGSGKDPTEVTGSWDVVFCLPSNQVAGSLVTGGGEAWSHPHTSNLLNDGWFSNGYYGNQWGLGFNGSTTAVNCGSGVALDDLADNEFTAEMWVMFSGTATPHRFMYKGLNTGWEFSYESTGRLDLLVYCGTTSALCRGSIGLGDNKWHHIVCYFNDAGDRKPYVAVDGSWLTYVTHTAGVGAVLSDASYSLIIGSNNPSTYGWVRISNNDRYNHGTNFVPPRTCPAADANTIEQWLVNEGNGSTLTATVTSPANDGTITNGTWVPQWYDEGTPVIPKSVVFNGSSYIDCGSDAGLDNLYYGDFTAECWTMSPPNVVGNIFSKGNTLGGWSLEYHNTVGLIATVLGSVGSQLVYSGFHVDNAYRPTHLAITYSNSGDKRVRLFINGVFVAVGGVNSGIYASDAAFSLHLGKRSDISGAYRLGTMGWARISNSIRYPTNFTPPSRFSPPAVDANTLAQWNMSEGAGTTVDNVEGTATRDGTLVGCTWNNTLSMDVDAPGYRAYNWGYTTVADSVNDGVKQTLTGLAPGSSFVIRTSSFTEIPYDGKPRLLVYDETNDATITYLDGAQQYDIVQNGGFDSDTKWTKGTGWSISGGVAHCDGTQTGESLLFQLDTDLLNGGLISRGSGTLWKVAFTVTNYVSGYVRVRCGTTYNTFIGSPVTGNGTYVHYSRYAGTPRFYVVADADFIGDIDNVSVSFVPEYTSPSTDILCFELPTVSRNGVASDCTSISIELLNAGSGLCGWNQCEMYSNALKNPSFDVGDVADPWIPSGWINNGNLDSGDTALETVDTHSYGCSLKINSSAITGESIRFTDVMWGGVGIPQGSYTCFGIFQKVKPGGYEVAGSNGANAKRQTGNQFQVSSGGLVNSTKQYWYHNSSVVRAANTVEQEGYPEIGGFSGATDSSYADDAYLILLNGVNLTVTPASRSNSAEGVGLRVDGTDTLVQSVTGLRASTGEVRFYWTPRHSAGYMLSFGSVAPFVFKASSNNDNYMQLYWTAASTLTLEGKHQGTFFTGSLAASGLIVANTKYLIRVVYTANGVKLFINGTERISVVTPVNFSPIPTMVYWGHCDPAAYQGDAVFS